MNLAHRTACLPSACVTRRRFLAASAAAVAAWPVAAAAASAPRWEMKLSTSSLHYRGLPLVDAVRRIGALGFQGIDVWSHFEWAGPLCEHLEDGLERLGLEPWDITRTQEAEAKELGLGEWARDAGTRDRWVAALGASTLPMLATLGVRPLGTGLLALVAAALATAAVRQERQGSSKKK